MYLENELKGVRFEELDRMMGSVEKKLRYKGLFWFTY